MLEGREGQQGGQPLIVVVVLEGREGRRGGRPLVVVGRRQVAIAKGRPLALHRVSSYQQEREIAGTSFVPALPNMATVGECGECGGERKVEVRSDLCVMLMWQVT
jgi:hypothetical protein